MKRLFAIVLLATAAAPAVAQQAPPMQARTTAATYVRMAASSDMYEKQSSEMALASAANPDVRAFAQMMISDHGATSAQVMAAAKQASVGKPGGLLPKQAMMLKSMRAWPKGKMERGYVDQQVVAHEEALALHSGYAAQGDNPGLRAVAASAVPIIETHLTEIKRIQTAMGGPMTR